MIKNWAKNHRTELLLAGPLFILCIALFYYVFGGRYESTDDAYVQAAKAEINSNVSGQVAIIAVKDNQKVCKGQLLLSLDSRPYKIAVESAKAQLSSAKLQIQALKATYQQQRANVQAAVDTLTYQQEELERQKKLASSGISSQMQLNQARNTYNNAKQQYLAATQEQENVKASLGNDTDIPVAQHPTVQQAQAKLDKANLNLSYTNIKAPMDGIVTKVELLQPGDYITVGSPIFALISDKNIWVEANFKETQIAYMQQGQTVTLVIDPYDITLTGHVDSTSPGTGSTFSILPPENATGNWVKIIQRVPIRIAIDHVEKQPFLRAGLSAYVTVDTKHSRFALMSRK